MLNQCNFIGRTGQQPEITYTASGTAVAKFSVACSEKWRDKNSQEMKERTEWVNCSAFGKLAEIIGQYVQKGSLLYVSGKMQTDKWQDQNGQDRYTTKIIVNEMKMLGSKGDSPAQTPAQQQGWGQPQQPQQQAPQQQPQIRQQQPPQQGGQQFDTTPPDFDDD